VTRWLRVRVLCSQLFLFTAVILLFKFIIFLSKLIIFLIILCIYSVYLPLCNNIVFVLCHVRLQTDSPTEGDTRSSLLRLVSNFVTVKTF
jgi:hypothetical protein